jgi:hypothetical protein
MSDEGIIVPAGGKPMPTNAVVIEGGASSETGAEIHGSFEREKGNIAVGVQGGISQKKGWGVSGFFKWVLGGK